MCLMHTCCTPLWLGWADACAAAPHHVSQLVHQGLPDAKVLPEAPQVIGAQSQGNLLAAVDIVAQHTHLQEVRQQCQVCAQSWRQAAAVCR